LLEVVNTTTITASRAPPSITAVKLATNFPREVCTVSSRGTFSPRWHEFANADDCRRANITRKTPEVNH
jgi:hypothetical protein